MKQFLVVILFTSSLFSQSVFPSKDSLGETRSRTYDVVHYKIEASFDEAKKMVIGKTSITLTPLLSAITEIVLDAEDMTVSSAVIGKEKQQFETKEKTLNIRLKRTLKYGDTAVVVIDYTALPKKGLYFVQPDSLSPDKPHQIWSQGEDMDNHHWFPCYDFPNDKATSEVIATVNNSYTVLSNGKLLSVKENKKGKTKTFHWAISKPHSSYLIMIAVGEYAVLTDEADGIPLEYYVYKNQIEDAKICLSHTPKIMKFFNQRIGYKYPWEKYAQITIRDFMFGGMENTTATTMMDRILVYNARSRVDESPASLIAHELAHQWWGDVVTCKDWRHLWLNESFASYFDPLYFEYAEGEDEFTNLMYAAQQSGIFADKTFGRKPIVSSGSYTSNIYPRGASVLNMLRFVLGDEAFFRSLKYYITKHQFTAVDTDDLKKAVEEATGQNLYWFFDQWVYKAGYPIFDVSYSYNDTTKTLALRVTQTQQQDSLTGIFQTPADIEISTSQKNIVERINIVKQDSTYLFSVNEKPVNVWFDKENKILKELHFEKSTDEWKYQALHGTDVVARRTAIITMRTQHEQKNYIPLFASILQNDAFWAVRQEAAIALGMMKEQSAEKTQALLSALHDVHPKVRAEAAAQLRAVHTAEVSSALRKAIAGDSSYSVEANALASLAKVDSILALPLLKSKINEWSYGNRVSNAALNAVAELDSTSGIELALKKIQSDEDMYGRYSALSILRKYGKNNTAVIQTLIGLLRDKSLNFGAISVLGEVGNVSAIPALSELAKKEDERAGKEAKKAIEKIQQREGK
ncbi:MAG: HEAT repeat domain-containing protein [Bacteroidetes bacterium]|nr:HEAT repeat domain-containing protein [Bacteroidota bacterium]